MMQFDIRNGLDYPGLKAKALVSPGDRVRLGQALFSDKHDPAVLFTAPGCGTVIEVNRGAWRALESVVVRLEERESPELTFDSFSDEQLFSADRAGLGHRDKYV